MLSNGMIDHGYMYVNIDGCWTGNPVPRIPCWAVPAAMPADACCPNRRFGEMQALADYIHAKGFKAGIYSSPGPVDCAGFASSYGHEELDARTFADWGYDFLKYDWCSYYRVARLSLGQAPNLEKLKIPFRVMSAALARQDRDIVFNLCQYGMGNVWKWGAEVGGQSWRTTADLGVGTSYSIAFSQSGREKWAGPGHWNDPDYLLLGWVAAAGAAKRLTPLTPNEQYSYVTLWSMLCLR